MLKKHLIHQKDAIICLLSTTKPGQTTALIAITFPDSRSLIEHPWVGGLTIYFHHN